jgi:RNA polymerase sigma factor (sigma-70 family)
LQPTRDDQEQTWAEFVAAYSGLLLHTCRTLARDRDAAMEGYAHLLAALREDDCRRLRAYTPRAGTRFTTWLVVVARRLLLDHHRHLLGRLRSVDEGHRAEHATRRRLHELVAAELDPDRLTNPAESSPDAALRRTELSDALRCALGELDPADRLLLALRFEDERPMREIAAELRLATVFHVYRRLKAVLTALRQSLARRGVEEPEP